MGGYMFIIPLQESEYSTLWSQTWLYASSSDVFTSVWFCVTARPRAFFFGSRCRCSQARKAEALARVTQRRSAPHDAGPRFTFLPEPHLPLPTPQRSGAPLFSLSDTSLSRYPTSSRILSTSNAPAASR
jgi:hypothetical protein